MAGCHKPLPEPERLDFIYNDLVAEYDKATKAAEETRKQIEEEEKSIEKTPMEDPARKVSQRKLRATKESLEKLIQTAEYFKLRAESRKAFARDSYARVFNTAEEKNWPPSAETDLYKREKALRSAPARWDSRVPKAKFVAGAEEPSKKPASKESGHGGGGH